MRHTSRWWEMFHAALARREPRHLFHAAMEVAVEGERFIIEMAPAWGGPPAPDRGVVRVGPVGLRILGGLRLFRYEVRCWRDGTIPDVRWAEGGPTILTDSNALARALVAHVSEVPGLTWGRSVGSTGDMWNSNSLASWLIVTSGLDAASLQPPHGGRAPGWRAGLAVAADPRLTAAGARRGTARRSTGR